MDTAEYVLVHNYLFRGLHTLYVDQYYPTMKLIRCMNSWGTKDPFPCFSIKDKEKNNLLYRVWASAEEIGNLALPDMPDKEQRKKQDDQGYSVLCTRYALSKAVANGFMDKKFIPGQEIDFDQSSIATELVNNPPVSLS